ncbi:sigma-70 family RNA polymerase sigma factor [Streptomyces cellulosae]
MGGAGGPPPRGPLARDLDLAEECVQEAYAAALSAWERDGIPGNPAAWLTTAAKRRAMDAIRRERTFRSKLPLLVEPEEAVDELALDELGEQKEEQVVDPEGVVPDERLRLIFTCCHPALAQEAQLALTLRLVCGLPTPDVARALLVSEQTMAARITRAKKKISAARIPYRMPRPAELPDRLTAVLGVIHLLFTAGHTAPSGPALMRTDLADRALHLARTLHDLMPDEPEARGLLALLLVTDARRATRTGADGRLLRLGTTAFPVWPTAAVRTVYEPRRDLFLKFSLDVRITNDIRRLWRHDLRRLRRTDTAAGRAFAALGPPAAWLSDRGYRTAAFAFEELAVLVRDGLRGHLLPGATPLLAAGLAEGFEDSPLAATDDPAGWWEAYLRQVVPPALTAFGTHGVVLEAHLQNTLVAVDAAGTPVQALFRDAEGAKLLPDVSRASGWERLVYCLVVNHLTEIAGALADHHPGYDPWPAVRRELARHDLPEIPALLTAPTLPGKTNLLLRWTAADGADARYLPLPNPLLGD